MSRSTEEQDSTRSRGRPGRQCRVRGEDARACGRGRGAGPESRIGAAGAT